MRIALSLFLLLALAAQAGAATCFWVGGGGNYDNTNTASWSSSSGGAAGTCAATGGIPKNSADVATFDASSGGGTVVVCGASSANCPSASGSLNLGSSGQIVFGAFTGTLDFATNDPSVNVGSVNGSGTGTRTFNMGDGTWTVNQSTGGTGWAFATTTNLTFAANGSTIVLAGNGGMTFAGGGLTYNALSLGAVNNGQQISFTGNNTFASVTITGPRQILLPGGGSMTITNAPTWAGSVSAPIIIESSVINSAATIAVSSGTPSLDWVSLRLITFTGTAGTATNSVSFGGNSGITITAPSTGGAHIIGGGL